MKWYSYLSQHRAITFALLVGYYLLVVLPHVIVGKAVNAFFSGLGRANYNLLIAGLACVIMLTIFTVLRKSLSSHPDKRKLHYYVAGSVVAMILSFAFLFVINIEIIHFVQYGLMACLLLPLTRSCKQSMALCVVLGAVDELYQYLYLDTSAPYYDFNDVLFDTLGAGMALVMLKIVGVTTERKITEKWWQQLELQLLGVVALILGCMAIMGWFSVNPSANGDLAFFTLFKEAPTGFWTYPGGPHARLHILTPIPGMILIFVAAYFYSRLDEIVK